MSTPTTDADVLDKIRAILEEYDKPETQQLYKELVEATCEQCETMLKSVNGKRIQCVLQGRSKKCKSLHDKLNGLRKDPGFKDSVSAIYEHPEMGDLAGVRIGLYFPDDISKVAKVIEEHFDIKHVFGTVTGGRSTSTERNSDIDKHMNGKWYSQGPFRDVEHWEHYGYKSWQVVVEWKGLLPEQLKEKSAGLDPRPLRVEIQVGTVVTQAWAEVQHNIIYKNPDNIHTTPTMKRMIDAINGLAITTDIMLKELEQNIETAKEEKKKQLAGKSGWSAP